MKTKKWYNLNKDERLKRFKRLNYSKLIASSIGLIVIVLLVIYNNNMTKKAIKECVESGNTYNYCYVKYTK